ncbi:Aste57867_20071 [Aphanomyces stellatus]|uniref:Aste57867_20071 protein n=1 Tax=Aphanomyces stellatus TaxID=120398 RepID=A0A485LE85_9STRA|nr:hypothetical protein As57867_020005 [Aphanomyces stellatus]VFT96766.1 Aste57867_20071 [Aphanomyces stellatus]
MWDPSQLGSMPNGQLVAVKAMNAVSAFANSALSNFLPLFFSASFDKFQIGVLASICSVTALVSPPLWGALADILHMQRTVHVFCLITATVLMFAIQFTVPDFYATCAVVFLANFQMNPTGSLLDQAVMALVERVGGEYGKQRLFSAVGWGLGAFVTGLLVSTYGVQMAFYVFLVTMTPTLVILQSIPTPDPPSRHPTGADKAPLSFGESIRRVAGQPDVLLLLVVVLLLGVLLGIMSSFLGLFLYELSDNSSTVVGTVTWVQTLSELPAFFFADAIVKRYGIVRVLFCSIVGCGVRMTYYAIVLHAWTVLPFELLHGVTFALPWAAFTQYIYDTAPPGTHGTMMGLLNAVLNGLGHGAGNLLGGYLYQTSGARTMWLVADLGVPLALVGLYFFAKCLPPPRHIVDLRASPSPSGEQHPLKGATQC